MEAAMVATEALNALKSVDPPLWLAPSPNLSRAARDASRQLFDSLKPFCPKSPFDQLLVEGFDAEQIWQQLDLQSQPLLASLRRELRRFEKNPEEVAKGFGEERKKLDRESGDLERGSGDFEAEEEEDEGMEELDEAEEEEEEMDDDGDDEQDEEDGGNDGAVGIEDRFLKIKELEEYLEEDEAREYGLKKKKKKKKKKEGDGKALKLEENDEFDVGEREEADGDEDEEEDDELGVFGDGDVEADAVDELENTRYEDFFGHKKKKDSKRKLKPIEGSDDELEEDEAFGPEKKENLSTHEKQLKKLRSKIEQMEKLNLEPKTWTMQGEVTADKRPKNSALEVDLDFEHNVRPAPVITEEVTASIEDLIRKRIVEGHYDDVQKIPTLAFKAAKEVKEIDENKSKKGLAEVYEEEYAQKTGLASAPLSFSDEQKNEASTLFKKLCLKLDALSHFHFSPKPIIEDMSIQANVPALAMEEIAPVAVSDAAMLAPEEVFAGKGDIKSEAELTQAERKKRRASKKRKFKTKAAKRMAKKARDLLNPGDGKEE